MRNLMFVLSMLMISTLCFASGTKNQGVNVQHYVYDFAVDGGGTGAHTLTTLHNNPLPANAVVKGITYWVETAFTSAGSAAISIGDGSSAAHYYASTAFNDSTYAVGFVKALSTAIPQLIDASNEGKLSITVATAALTAGKVHFWVEYFL